MTVNTLALIYLSQEIKNDNSLAPYKGMLLNDCIKTYYEVFHGGFRWIDIKRDLLISFNILISDEHKSAQFVEIVQDCIRFIAAELIDVVMDDKSGAQ